MKSYTELYLLSCKDNKPGNFSDMHNDTNKQINKYMNKQHSLFEMNGKVIYDVVNLYEYVKTHLYILVKSNY